MADGTITIDTRVDNSGIESGTSKLGSIASKGLGVATKAAKVMAVGIAAATGAVVALTKASIEQYAQYEQLTGGVETLFKDSSDKVMQYANNAYKTAGMSANEYMSTITGFSASLLQGLGGDTAKAADIGNQAVTDMADNANKMGTSMEDIQNAYQGFAKQNYTMLDNLKLGYGGTKTEMERLLADAQKVTGVKYDISNFSDVIEAIHVIQEQTGITGTTTKEAATTIEGSLNMTKSAWTNLMTGMSDDNADFDTLIDNFVDSASAFGQNIIPRIEIALNGIGKLIDELLPIIIDKIPEIVSSILPGLISACNNILTSILNALIQSLPTIIDAGMQIVQSLINGIQQSLPQVILANMQILTTLLQGLMQMLPQILEIGIQVIAQLIMGIAQQLPTLIPMAIECILNLVDTIINNIDLIIDAGIQLIIGLANGLINALPQLIEKAPVLIMNLCNAIARNTSKLAEAGVQLIFTLGVGLIKAIPTLVKNIPTIIKAILKVFKTMSLVDIGINLIKGLWKGIKSVGSWIWDKIKGFCSGILDKVKGFFGIHSPSRVFRDQVGKFLAQGIGVGFTLESPKVTKGMIDDLETNTDSLYSALRDSVDLETARTTAQVASNNYYRNTANTINNDNGITQNLTIVSPERTPLENAREIKRAGRDLAWQM